ncbi:hypothetical protein [Streptomyces asiaticus]
MESEVLAALVGMPAVLVTAAAAWAAGRVQSHGSYHGSVDAVRRAAQREAYAELYRTAHRFIVAFELAEARESHGGDRSAVEQMHALEDDLEHAVSMVSLEGPDSLADIAERILSSAVGLGGQRTPWGSWMLPFDPNSSEGLVARNEAMRQFSEAHKELLPEARRYLNGGPSR